MLRGPARCNLIVLRSRDLEQSDRFYRALGLEFERHAHGGGPAHLASELGEQVFEIYPLTKDTVPTSSARIGFAVASVDDAYSSLLQAGGKPVVAPRNSRWGRRAVVADPDGHCVELTVQPIELKRTSEGV